MMKMARFEDLQGVGHIRQARFRSFPGGKMAPAPPPETSALGTVGGTLWFQLAAQLDRTFGFIIRVSYLTAECEWESPYP